MVVSLVTLNDSDPVDVYTRDINSGSYYTEDIAVDSAGQTYVINTSTSPAAPFGAVEIYDGDTFIEERQLPGTPIGLVEAPSGDVYAVVAVYA